jgi:hypothetical protein
MLYRKKTDGINNTDKSRISQEKWDCQSQRFHTSIIRRYQLQINSSPLKSGSSKIGSSTDEIIIRAHKIRNRLIIEVIDRCGMQVGEVLKLRLIDRQDRTLILKAPKSGKAKSKKLSSFHRRLPTSSGITSAKHVNRPRIGYFLSPTKRRIVANRKPFTAR